MESLDITSELRISNEYYVAIPSQVLQFLSPEEITRHRACPDPVYRLRKALYGLQRSAYDWISTLLDLLREKGWISTHTDPALLYRDVDGTREFISVYVDDLMIAAPPQRLKHCWDEIKGRFIAGDPEAAREYIGVRFGQGGEDGCAHSVDMRDYAITLVEGYRNDPLGKQTKRSEVPMLAEGAKQLIWSAVDPERQRTGPKLLKRVQGYLGKLLWLSRTARPDLSHATTLFASNASV